MQLPEKCKESHYRPIVYFKSRVNIFLCFVTQYKCTARQNISRQFKFFLIFYIGFSMFKLPTSNKHNNLKWNFIAFYCKGTSHTFISDHIKCYELFFIYWYINFIKYKPSASWPVSKCSRENQGIYFMWPIKPWAN